MLNPLTFKFVGEFTFAVKSNVQIPEIALNESVIESPPLDLKLIPEADPTEVPLFNTFTLFSPIAPPLEILPNCSHAFPLV